MSEFLEELTCENGAESRCSILEMGHPIMDLTSCVCEAPETSRNETFLSGVSEKRCNGIIHYMRACRHCIEIKPDTEFYKDPSGPDGLKVTCKTCVCRMKRERTHARSIGYDGRTIEETHVMVILREALLKAYQNKVEVSVPVSVVNNPALVHNGLVIKPNIVSIRSILGVMEFPFDIVSPQFLIGKLKECDMKVRIYESDKTK